MTRDHLVRRWRRIAVLWLPVAFSLAALAVAGFVASVPPPSHCSQRIGIHADIAIVPFLLFGMSGLWVTVRSPVAQRLVLWLGVSILLAVYVAGLSVTFEDVVGFKVSCAVNAK